jgi:hypothetical protein
MWLAVIKVLKSSSEGGVDALRSAACESEGILLLCPGVSDVYS